MKYLFIILFSSLVFFCCNDEGREFKVKTNNISEELAHKKKLEKTVKFFNGKDSVEAYFTTPSGNGPFPAVIILHEQWGLTEWIRVNSEALANKGYAALAIDLYNGIMPKNFDEAQTLMQQLDNDNVIRIVRSAYDFLENHSKVKKEKIGLIGWGMGGGLALESAVNFRDFKAVIVNYGNLVTERKKIRKIKSPLMGIFGETDRSIPVMDIQAFKETLNDLEKENKIIIYRNVGHGFMNPNNKSEYNADITERAWREIFKFLGIHLS
ncbi:MAG: dienelactone hydrolase family protein [Ignavibacteriaceae bacterium]|nr:dienelactone hydrolase family protein [Ignavibacteriaceae bacterium]